jgi:hypothetical protein
LVFCFMIMLPTVMKVVGVFVHVFRAPLPAVTHKVGGKTLPLHRTRVSWAALVAV